MRYIVLELRGMFRSKYNMIAFISVILLGILMGVYNVSSAKTDVIKNQWEYSQITGKEAIETDRSYTEKYQGDITEEKLVKAVKNYNESYSPQKEKFKTSKEALELRPVLNILWGFAYIDKGVSLTSSDFQIKEKYAAEFYDVRGEIIEKKIGRIKDHEIAKKISDMEKSIEKPFRYFNGYRFWNTGIERLILLVTIIFLVCIFIVSPVYSSMAENGSRYVLNKTIQGRRNLGRAKNAAVFIYVSMVYVLSVGVYLGIGAVSFGTEGLKTSIQHSAIISPMNFTMGNAIAFYVLAGYISVLSMSSIVIFISSKAKRTSIVLIISYSLYAIYVLLVMGMQIKNIHVQNILDITPFGLTQSFFLLMAWRFVKIIGKVFWLPAFGLIANCIGVIIFNWLSIGEFVKKEK